MNTDFSFNCLGRDRALSHASSMSYTSMFSRQCFQMVGTQEEVWCSRSTWSWSSPNLPKAENTRFEFPNIMSFAHILSEFLLCIGLKATVWHCGWVTESGSPGIWLSLLLIAIWVNYCLFVCLSVCPVSIFFSNGSSCKVAQVSNSWVQMILLLKFP